MQQYHAYRAHSLVLFFLSLSACRRSVARAAQPTQFHRTCCTCVSKWVYLCTKRVKLQTTKLNSFHRSTRSRIFSHTLYCCCCCYRFRSSTRLHHLPIAQNTNEKERKNSHKTSSQTSNTLAAPCGNSAATIQLILSVQSFSTAMHSAIHGKTYRAEERQQHAPREMRSGTFAEVEFSHNELDWTHWYAVYGTPYTHRTALTLWLVAQYSHYFSLFLSLFLFVYPYSRYGYESTIAALLLRDTRFQQNIGDPKRHYGLKSMRQHATIKERKYSSSSADMKNSQKTQEFVKYDNDIRSGNIGNKFCDRLSNSARWNDRNWYLNICHWLLHMWSALVYFAHHTLWSSTF